MNSKFKLINLIAFLVLCQSMFAESFKDKLQPIFEEKCISCHGKNGKVKGKINLLEIKSIEQLMQKPELLEDIIIAIEDKDMPPEDEPQLSDQEFKTITSDLKGLLKKSISSLNSIPHTEIRRMNRFQYNNAVTDLLELKVILFPLPEKMMREYGYFNPASGKMPDKVKVGSRPLGKSQLIERRLGGVSPFPQDLRAEHGFDNRGDHLSLSPILMESFMALSKSIVESNDFRNNTVGIWKEFFQAPKKNAESTIKPRLQKFLTKAFRKTVDQETLDRYTQHVLGKMKSGLSYTDSMKTAVSAVLASPRFLYIYDNASSDNAEKLDNFELASKMSFFLWGSIPDDELLELAEAGKLSNEKVYLEQIDRMLKDKKLKRFCDSFAPQWMQLERIISSTPDKKQFKDFYFTRFRKSMHMMLEPLLMFETVLIEDKSILNFVDSDFTYQASVIEDWYLKKSKGKPAPAVNTFHRRKLTDRRQGGIITTPAVLTMTSGIHRSHPITRGAWILTVIFNDPPLPPPADVPTLPEKAQLDDTMTLREKFAEHRTRQDCKACHIKLDPLGFAMENFDAVGRWREKYENGRDVDSSGVLYKKHKFTNVSEFKDAILKEKDRYVRGFAKHLLSFALGREVKAADNPSLDQITLNSEAADLRFKSMIKEVMKSQSFLNKYNPKQGVASVK